MSARRVRRLLRIFGPLSCSPLCECLHCWSMLSSTIASRQVSSSKARCFTLIRRRSSTVAGEQKEGQKVSPKAAFKQPLQAPRGMHDIFGPEQRKRRFVEDTCRRVAQVYGFEELATPLVEEEAVFSRTLGADSDVVSKEMYVFPDRSNNMLALRPEGTAGVVRAAINHRHELGGRIYYSGPMFRYERPQKGRTRQVCTTLLPNYHVLEGIECGKTRK